MSFEGSSRGSEGSKGPHPDYERNKEVCREFVKNIRESLLEGMSVALRDAHEIPKCLFTISWMSPLDAKMGNFATPIFLHQAHEAFKKELSPYMHTKRLGEISN